MRNAPGEITHDRTCSIRLIHHKLGTVTAKRRAIFRLLSRAGAGLLVLAGLTGYGWRYGFTPLPQPEPGVTVRLDDLFAPEPLTESNFWHQVRTLSNGSNPRRLRAAGASRSPAGPRRPFILPGAEPPVPRSAPPAEPAGIETAELLAVAARAAAAADRRPPRTLHSEDLIAFRQLYRAVVLAGETAAQRGEAELAFAFWLAAWRLHAALVPAVEFAGFFDERGLEEVNVQLARPFRELALTGPALSPQQTRRWLDELAAVGRLAGTAAESYARQVEQARPALGAARRPDWSRLRRVWSMAGMLIRQDAGRLFVDVLERVLGRRMGGEPNYHGAAHLLRPLADTVETLQIWLARPEDFDRMEAACLTRTLAALQAESLPGPPSPGWWPGPSGPGGWWRRVFDRPAVWRLPRHLPLPEPALESARQWRLYLESCRLALALRAYRDARGRWPDRLEELVPAFLATLPPDPFRRGSVLRYVRTEAGWRFWSVGPEQRDPAPDEYGNLPQRVFEFREPRRTGPKTGRPGFDAQDKKRARKGWWSRGESNP